VTLLAIAVPLNIGYAQIAGLPPTAGLYALVLPAVLYALTVSSRQLVASPDAAAAALVASSVGGLAAAGSQSYVALALAQAIISGVLFIAFGFLKLGFIANFLSKPILIGFVGGLALDILVSQVAKMLGVKIDSGGEFLEKLRDLVTGLPRLSLVSLLLAAAAVVVLVGGRRIAGKAPWALIVLVVATVVTVVAHLDDHGVAVLGEVPAGPPTFTWPDLDLSQWFTVVPSAIALTLVTTAEGLLVSRSYSERRGYPIDANRELVAFVLALVNLTRRAANPAVDVPGTTEDPDQPLPCWVTPPRASPGSSSCASPRRSSSPMSACCGIACTPSSKRHRLPRRARPTGRARPPSDTWCSTWRASPTST
jgi:MFS superfamily sulfate permease-like transporter